MNNGVFAKATDDGSDFYYIDDHLDGLVDSLANRDVCLLLL